MRVPTKVESILLAGGFACGLATAWIASPFVEINSESSTKSDTRLVTGSDTLSLKQQREPLETTKLVTENVHEKTRLLLETYAEFANADSGSPNHRLVDKLSELLQTSDESRRTLHFSLLIEAMRAEDGLGIAQMFEDLKGQGLAFDPESNFFAQRWGEVDPDAALEFIVEKGAYERDATLLRQVVTGWASKSPEEATIWVLKQADGELKDAALDGAARGWARTSPEGATDFLMQLDDNPLRNQLAQTMFWQILYGRGIGAAVSWYDAIPDSAENVRDSVFPHLVERQLLRNDPAAREWVKKRSPEPTN